MKFAIERTSDFEGKNKPIDGAVLEEHGKGYNIWSIEVDTLEHLVVLAGNYNIVIKRSRWKTDLPVIEIYDDYRE